MKLFVNQVEKQNIGFQGKKMCELVEFVSKFVVPHGEIISDVKVDGKPILWKDDDRDVSSCLEVEITTRNAREVIVSGLIEAHRIYPQFQEQLLKISDNLGTARHRDELKDFASCMETLQWYYVVLSGVQGILGISYREIPHGADFAKHLETLKISLHGVSVALQEENFVLLSDCIRYELVPVLSELHEFVPVFIKESDRKFVSLS